MGIRTVGQQRPALTGEGALSYARESTSVQDSIDAQHRANKRTAERLGTYIRLQFQDKKSGLRSDRAGYQDLLEAAATGEYRFVLVFKADRLSRDDEEFMKVCRELLRKGLEIHDYTLGPITPENVGLLALLGRKEIEFTSQRTRMKLEDLAANGTKIGRLRPGYQPVRDAAGKPVGGEFEIDPVLGDIITELFRRADGGESLGRLRHWYNEQTGAKKNVAQIHDMLRCEFYKGLNVQCKTHRSKLERDKTYARPKEDWKVTKHELPLIDEATWDRVQVRLDLQRNVGQQRVKSGSYALTGLIWCGRCSRRMQGRTFAKRGTKRYVCAVCSLERALPKTEQAVLRLLRALPISHRDILDAATATFTKEHARLTADVATVEREITRLSEGRTLLRRKLRDGVMTDDDYREAIKDTDQELRGLEDRRMQLTARLRALPATIEAFVLNEALLLKMPSWDHLVDEGTVEDQQRVYRHCIERVTWLDDRRTIEVRWTPNIAPYMRAAVQTIVP
jgi:site-specific DNA recombinase